MSQEFRLGIQTGASDEKIFFQHDSSFTRFKSNSQFLIRSSLTIIIHLRPDYKRKKLSKESSNYEYMISLPRNSHHP